MEDTLPSLCERLRRDIDVEVLAGRHGSALELIEKAAEAVSQTLEVQLTLGIILRNLGRLAESARVLDEISRKSPDNIHVLHQLAITQHLLGDMAASDAALDVALALNPGHPGILLGKIQNARRAGDPRQLLERAGQALRAHPGHIAFSLLYGEALRRAGQLKDSRRHLDSVFARCHHDAGTCLELARVRMSDGRHDAARALIEKALRRNPDHLEVLQLGIECAVASGRLIHAFRFARTQPASMAASLARLYRTAQHPERALEVLDALGHELDGSLQATLIRADALADLRQYAPARDLYMSVLSKAPNEPNAILKLIDIALRRHGPDSLSRFLDDLQADQLNNSGPPWLLIEATAHAGDWVRLRALCSSLAESAFSTLGSRAYFLALALFGLGELPAARLESCLALAVNPKDFRSRVLLADIELALGRREASLAVRKSVATNYGLAQQSTLLVHALDLLRVGAFDEAKALYASLGRFDGYLPTSIYIDELLRQGESVEAATSTERVNHALAAASPSRPELAGAPSLDFVRAECIERERLVRLFDFDHDCGLFGREVHPHEFIAWSLTQGAYGDFERWSRRARQATLAARALYLTPARAEDLEDFVVPPDITPLLKWLDQGSGVILAGSHMGPPVGRSLTQLLPGIQYFQNLQAAKPSSAFGAAGIAVTGKPQEAAVAAVRALRHGGVLSTTPDVDIRRLTRGRSSTTIATTARLFGVEVEISNMAPKLSRELKVPSFWLQTRWEGGKIHFVFEALPVAGPDEPPYDWHSRWAQAYFCKLEALMTSAPENQNLDAPLWRYLLYFANESALLKSFLGRVAQT